MATSGLLHSSPSSNLIEYESQDNLAKMQENHGACFCPIILGSDKTMVSVASGQNDYYPLYISNGLIQNHIH